jgi:2-C-methyl-D-erythritol 4-phosphate cytidylyltransferase/2-C-methyl-D-erythritol 2,4-cyclodiphosphate synthase
MMRSDVMRVSAIIAAGGRGTRAGADRPKQFLEIAGRSLLDLTVAAIAASRRVDDIVVAVPADHLEAIRSRLRDAGKPVAVVAGGRRRQDSVANALGHVSPESDIVVVHDAARPFVTQEVIDRTIDAAATYGAAIAAIPARDTVKQASAFLVEGSHVVQTTLRREEIFLAQTPQAFRRHVLERAFEVAGALDATDEAMLAERAGVQVHLVPGDPANIKVTTPADFETARTRAASLTPEDRSPASAEASRPAPRALSLEPSTFRIGTGYDLHRLVSGRPLILGGVRIPFDRGLEGHSDADIVCHAVTDALLGAAATGDIGQRCPDTDERWRDADSLALLRAAVDDLSARGYRVGNVDVTVIAQQPKLLPYLESMRTNLAAALRVDAGAVSVKGKTNEQMDSMGRGESMACHAVALLVAGR